MVSDGTGLAYKLVFKMEFSGSGIRDSAVMSITPVKKINPPQLKKGHFFCVCPALKPAAIDITDI